MGSLHLLSSDHPEDLHNFDSREFVGRGREMIDLAAKGLHDFVSTFAFVKHEVRSWEGLPIEQVAVLAQELGWRALTKGRIDALVSSTTDSWFWVLLNGVRLQLPRYTLMTMRHCVEASSDGVIRLSVETDHWKRIKEELVGDALFLDIGAATGAMSVPYAMNGHEGLRIVAFEPSRRARGYLEATIRRNDVPNIIVLPVALSDGAGSFEFVELPEDSSGLAPFLPEASHLQINGEAAPSGAKCYSVGVSTLDRLAVELPLHGCRRLVLKIDVEGFEDKVLRGGVETLAEFKPFLSIDIHNHPGSSKLTDAACVEILKPLGYNFERLGHVLLAT